MTTRGCRYRCGYVALVGRPNVGKSTLLNCILDQKISITSHKPQTTRHRILGIKTTDTEQVIYVDTPGISEYTKKAMNRYMIRTAIRALNDVDVIVFLIESTRWDKQDNKVLEHLEKLRVPVILAINKVDLVKHKSELLPFMEKLSINQTFSQIIPLSAYQGTNVPKLEGVIRDFLNESEPYFPADQITDRSERFMAAEVIREKLMRSLDQELPYNLTVEIERFRNEEDLLHINAIIWVGRASHKGIVIGKQGKHLKEIGRRARRDLEKKHSKKVFLELWVKIKQGWADDERMLNGLGYTDDS